MSLFLALLSMRILDEIFLNEILISNVVLLSILLRYLNPGFLNISSSQVLKTAYIRRLLLRDCAQTNKSYSIG